MKVWLPEMVYPPVKVTVTPADSENAALSVIAEFVVVTVWLLESFTMISVPVLVLAPVAQPEPVLPNIQAALVEKLNLIVLRATLPFAFAVTVRSMASMLLAARVAVGLTAVKVGLEPTSVMVGAATALERAAVHVAMVAVQRVLVVPPAVYFMYSRATRAVAPD